MISWRSDKWRVTLVHTVRNVLVTTRRPFLAWKADGEPNSPVHHPTKRRRPFGQEVVVVRDLGQGPMNLTLCTIGTLPLFTGTWYICTVFVHRYVQFGTVCMEIPCWEYRSTRIDYIAHMVMSNVALSEIQHCTDFGSWGSLSFFNPCCCGVLRHLVPQPRFGVDVDHSQSSTREKKCECCRHRGIKKQLEIALNAFPGWQLVSFMYRVLLQTECQWFVVLDLLTP